MTSMDKGQALPRQRHERTDWEGDTTQPGAQWRPDSDRSRGRGARRETNINIAGVRFGHTARIQFFRVHHAIPGQGSWVVAQTSLGQEAGFVVVAPGQLRLSQLGDGLKPIDRLLTDDDLRQLASLRELSCQVLEWAREISRARRMAVDVMAGQCSMDGSAIRLSHAAEDCSSVEKVRELVSDHYGLAVQMWRVPPRDSARLVGGLGWGGSRSCSYPMPGRYPGCSILLEERHPASGNVGVPDFMPGDRPGWYSHEDRNYREVKAGFPPLGQGVSVAAGDGTIVARDLVRERITIRYDHSGREETVPASELHWDGADGDFPTEDEQVTGRVAPGQT